MNTWINMYMTLYVQIAPILRILFLLGSMYNLVVKTSKASVLWKSQVQISQEPNFNTHFRTKCVSYEYLRDSVKMFQNQINRFRYMLVRKH